MINRILAKKVKGLLSQFPAVAILGARQVGKTTLAKDVAPQLKKDWVHLDLERPMDRLALSENPELYFETHKEKCVIIDEVQRMPSLFPILRPIIDDHRIPSRFLLLGSASPSLKKESSESLAGRIVYTELTGLNIAELPKSVDLHHLWLYGGFPDPCLSKRDDYAQSWHESFLNTYFERDLKVLGLQTLPMHLSRLFSMITHMQSSTCNISSLSRTIGLDRRTIENILQFFINSYMIRILFPFHINTKKRLVKSPKYYIRDSGIFHHTSHIHNIDMLLKSPMAGASWEGFVIEQVTSAFPHLEPYFYRTQTGAECDLVLVKGHKPIVCIEAKMSSMPTMTKSFASSIKDLKTINNFIVIPSCNQSYSVSLNTIVCSLPFLLTKLPSLFK